MTITNAFSQISLPPTLLKLVEVRLRASASMPSAVLAPISCTNKYTHTSLGALICLEAQTYMLACILGTRSVGVLHLYTGMVRVQEATQVGRAINFLSGGNSFTKWGKSPTIGACQKSQKLGFKGSSPCMHG